MPKDAATEEVIETRQQILDWMAGSGRPDPEDWRIGTEHEKFLFHKESLNPLPYQAERDGNPGIGAILEALVARFGWQPIREGETLIAAERDGASLTLEPGGQFELSGAQLKTLHQTCGEIGTHLAEMRELGREMGFGMLGMGHHPTARREDIPWMPKGRYKIMRRYMPLVGSLGLDMMLRTCTVQVNLDYGSEADMVEKFRIALALQPVATALFAASPFREGAPNGFQSWRSHIWTDTDPDRTGMLPFVFEDGFGFERYVDYLLDVPMYFVYRDGQYIDVAGQSFRHFLEGRLEGLPGEKPRWADWRDQLTVAFPEVRLKRYLEMRGADAGPTDTLCALPALWVGLLYDAEAQGQAAALIQGWTPEDHAWLRDQVPRHGLATPFRTGTVRDLASQVLVLAEGGLRRRAALDAVGLDETPFLNPLIERVTRGQSLSDRMLERFHGDWGGSVLPVFKDFEM